MLKACEGPGVMTDDRRTQLEALLREALILTDDLRIGIVGALLAHCLDHLREHPEHR